MKYWSPDTSLCIVFICTSSFQVKSVCTLYTVFYTFKAITKTEVLILDSWMEILWHFTCKYSCSVQFRIKIQLLLENLLLVPVIKASLN